MMLSLVTAPTLEPVTLAEAKLQCRVDHDDEDALFLSLIRVAREHAETYTGRAFLLQTWDLIGRFPVEQRCQIRIPFAPLVSVASVTYRDPVGTTQTWSSARYRVVNPAGPASARAWIEPQIGEIYPITDSSADAMTVRAQFGYGSASAVPVSIKHAILLLVEHWYVNRGAVVVSVGGTATELPMGVDALLWRYKGF
jgi:uncharacterized phiE125 gp8 family phage protein